MNSGKPALLIAETNILSKIVDFCKERDSYIRDLAAAVLLVCRISLESQQLHQGCFRVCET